MTNERCAHLKAKLETLRELISKIASAKKNTTVEFSDVRDYLDRGHILAAETDMHEEGSEAHYAAELARVDNSLAMARLYIKRLGEYNEHNLGKSTTVLK